MKAGFPVVNILPRRSIRLNLDIFDTADASAFQASVEKLEKVFPQLFSHTPPPRIVAATRGSAGNDLIAQAFRKERLK